MIEVVEVAVLIFPCFHGHHPQGRALLTQVARLNLSARYLAADLRRVLLPMREEDRA